MNRKILLAVLALAIVLLATPMVGLVQAGKGQTKQDFNLVFIGSYTHPPKEIVTTNTVHIFDMPFITLGPPIQTVGPPITLTVGSEVFTSDFLSYSGTLHVNLY